MFNDDPGVDVDWIAEIVNTCSSGSSVVLEEGTLLLYPATTSAVAYQHQGRIKRRLVAQIAAKTGIPVHYFRDKNAGAEACLKAKETPSGA